MTPTIHLVAWDVCCPARLRRVGRAVRAWKAAGQRSAAECWLQASTRDALVRHLETIMDPETDRLHVVRLDPRLEVRLYGIARRPTSLAFLMT